MWPIFPNPELFHQKVTSLFPAHFPHNNNTRRSTQLDVYFHGSSYRIPPVELHTLGQARLALRPSLHFLHDPLDVIPGDPVEKHGSRSWTQRTTACLCLAAHNFHITVPLPPLFVSAHPKSGEGSARGSEEKLQQQQQREAQKTEITSLPSVWKATGRRRGRKKKSTQSDGGFPPPFFPSLSSRKKQKQCIVQKMRPEKCRGGRGGDVQGEKEGWKEMWGLRR